MDWEGITPAYAGNTPFFILTICKLEDHPRIRGEHGSLNFKVSHTLGSPPHTRGTRYELRESEISEGITPAYAGNTLEGELNNNTDEDHPRILGEHNLYICCRVPYRGSPPHTRGTPTTTQRVSAIGRITPAYAGNTPHHF